MTVEAFLFVGTNVRLEYTNSVRVAAAFTENRDLNELSYYDKKYFYFNNLR